MVTKPTIGQIAWGGVLNAALDDLQAQISGIARSVRDFGAVGDGIANDTAAVQAAINAGGVTYFPPGTYDVTTLTLPSGAVLRGLGRTGTTASPAGQRATLRLRNGTNAALISGPSGISNVTIENLNFDGNKANNASGDIINLASGAAQDTAWHITDCYLDNSANDGIFIGTGRQAVQIMRTWVYRSDNNGIVVNGSDAHISNSLIGLSGSNAIYIGASVQHITDCDIWSSSAHGVVVDGAQLVSLRGCGIDRHQQRGVSVISGSATLIGCKFHSNSQAANNTHPHINVAAGTVSVSGCIFGDDGLAANPNYCINITGGTVRDSGSVTTPGTAATGFINDVTKIVADTAGHTPYDHGLNSWTHDPGEAGAGVSVVNGTMYVLKQLLRRPAPIDTLWWIVTNGATTPTAGQNWIGVYDSAGTRLAQLDIGAASATAGTKPSAITAQILQPGFYWVALLFNAATPPQLNRAGTGESGPNINLAAADRRAAVAGTGLTTLPASFTPGSLTTTNSLTLFAGMSQ